ncbi:hypothetical protein J1782_07290 [Rahnella sp. BCC 1045]|uniref:relaxase/mobilization nuclease domain-containing protein n=1 Tax=Rahnella sp. BCC 1045 TaxID=2816251 RepID=UPI001C26E94F|nr:relaxase/mobilization nuclease domain-containing protein [Rahnella sp. BCC 1045]MBU9819690.1 hypothetical protein [Rahnella sp. BCC 1045]
MMIVNVYKPMRFDKHFVLLTHHLFAVSGVMPGVPKSMMFSAKAMANWIHKQCHIDGEQWSLRPRYEGGTFETTCFDIFTALAEMSVQASQNTRCLSPAVCFTLSWGVEDVVSDDAAFASVRLCREALGLSAMPYAAVVRRNDAHTWCNILVSRIPESGGKAASMWRNVDTLQHACREAELLHGWKHEKGSWVIEHDEIVRPRKKG